jgi:chromosome segregation ATPase
MWDLNSLFPVIARSEEIMRRWAFLIPILLLIPASAAGQGSSKDSQALQDLLTEVRQLRQDLQTTVVALQRAEILLYRVRTQQDVVAQATGRLDKVRSELTTIRNEQKALAGLVKSAEDSPQEIPTNAGERKELAEQLPMIKTRLEALAVQEQEKEAVEADADQHLRDEQAKLADLESQLDRLDAELQNRGRPAASSTQ